MQCNKVKRLSISVTKKNTGTKPVFFIFTLSECETPFPYNILSERRHTKRE